MGLPVRVAGRGNNQVTICLFVCDSPSSACVVLCDSIQELGIGVGVTAKGPESGPVPQKWEDIDSSDQYWLVVISNSQNCAHHKGQRRPLPWELDCSQGSTFDGRMAGLRYNRSDRPLHNFEQVPSQGDVLDYHTRRTTRGSHCASCATTRWLPNCSSLASRSQSLFHRPRR